MTTVQEAKELICELCAEYYKQGWVSGTGGGMSIQVADGSGTIVMAPSGVPKERMRPSDMFVLDREGAVKEAPTARPPPYKAPKLTECAPLFQSAFQLRGAGAVVHSHSTNAVMATMLDERATEFHVTQLEMVKGIAGHGFYDDCVVPIIENTARECELTDRLQAAIKAYPRASAVLVRRHGVYVWGPNWVAAKSQAESYDYLFECAVRLRSLGIDVAKPSPVVPQPLTNGQQANGHADDGPPTAKRQKTAKLPAAIVLDIEGTVAPISFVTEVLFPYAAERLQSHLEATFDAADTQKDVQLFREQMGDGAPAASADQAAVIAAVVAAAKADMAADRKTTALKSLQGHIWHGGFASGALQAKMYPDVAPALARWHSMGIKTYIYSSGSRAAQRDLFGHTADGDLRAHLSGFFDTSSGPKVEAGSYDNIALSLGMDSPADILFATDNEHEAAAAIAAGWQVALTVRPGNKLLPAAGLPTQRIIYSMAELLEQ
jgi:methylthioribulose 1-phosphate dehydratase/enolase-phosphatase E1